MVAAERRFLGWWLLPALLVIVWLAWQLWHARNVAIPLPLMNNTEEAIALEFYGPGLSQRVQVEMTPMSRRTVALPLAAHGVLRIRVATPRLQSDAVLLDDARLLQAGSQQFEIRPGGEFVLVTAN